VWVFCWLTVEDVRRPLASPSTAVGAALEQVRCIGDVTTSPSLFSYTSIFIAVGVRVTASDTQRRVAGGLRLGRTGARSDGVHSL